MNKKNVVFAAMLAATLTSSISAFAADGTITITGQVVDASCAVSVSGGAADATVVLPSVSTTSLTDAGSTAGSTPISMALTGCPTTGSVRAFFETQNVDPATGNLTNNAASTPAGNVQVQVINLRDSTPIDLRDNSNNEYVAFTDSGTDGTANLNYGVQYVATGPSSAGMVDTALVYTLDYQ